MIYFRDYGDILAAVVGSGRAWPTEIVRQVAQILRAALHGKAREHRQIALAQSGKHDAIGGFREVEMAGNPRGSGQGNDGDGQNGHTVPEARLRPQILQHAAQSRLGQLAGDKKQVRDRHGLSLTRIRGG